MNYPSSVKKCGKKAILRCSSCSSLIPRDTVGFREVPKFCEKCGTAYRWMQERLDTAKELLWHDDKLSLEDRDKPWDLLQYVMSNKIRLGTIEAEAHQHLFREGYRCHGRCS